MIKKSNFHSIPSQAKRLDERHTDNSFEVAICGMKIAVEPGVYQTSEDSELMAESVEITKNQNFLEIGCGTGVVSISVAKRAANGIGVDINEKAVANARRNAEAQKIDNLQFFVSDVFEKVTGNFDVIICNPPYTKHDAKDNIERMFWDPENEMKQTFFKEVGGYLKMRGKIYFGWADFADIDTNLPFKLAEKHGYILVNTFKKPHKNDFHFYVLEFTRKPA
ncbi:MAG: class I SAM-dependent methyltransferase [Candidatus Yonathbacteria bacterium]|nr:class I SAM-dependent methyltransferase [Candidatus Yonathbacteria bacterium]NTW47381.1 class I SAM-dependent methyltransferase [Candidatus Yonathbacteria bacterium]